MMNCKVNSKQAVKNISNKQNTKNNTPNKCKSPYGIVTRYKSSWKNNSSLKAVVATLEKPPENHNVDTNKAHNKLHNGDKVCVSPVQVHTDRKQIVSTQTQTEISVTNKLRISNELLSQEWISDVSLQPYLDILEHKFLKKTKCIILNPLVLNAVQNCEEFAYLLEHYNIESKDILIMAVNDSIKVTTTENTPGGTHWSLLVYNKVINEFHYFDSFNNYNINSARKLAEKMSSYLGGNALQAKFVELNGPQQSNSCDCGVYVCWLIEAMVYDIITYGAINNDQLQKVELNELDIISKRSCLAYTLCTHGDMNEKLLIELMLRKPHNNITSKATLKPKTIKQIEAVNKNIPEKPHCQTSSKTNSQQLSDETEWTKVPKKKRRSSQLQENTSESTQWVPITELNQFEVLNKQSGMNGESPLVAPVKTITETIPGRKSGRKLGGGGVTTTISEAGGDGKKQHLTVLADSQGRDLSSFLANSTDGFEVLGYVFPGATVENVVKWSNAGNLHLDSYSKKDWILMIGGSNDVKHHHTIKDIAQLSKSIKSTLKSQITKFQQTNLIISTIPYRYDLHRNEERQHIILELNNNIRSLVNNYPNTHLLDLCWLERTHYTQAGFHINRKGKKSIAKTIRSIITDSKPTKEGGKVKRARASFSAGEFLSVGDKEIKAIDEDMTQLLKAHRNNSSVAFAHCISGDFGHEKQMTAGVAVKFKKEFGKPSLWNCVSNHLAYQESKEGAGIYSLITKLNYYDKPKINDYDQAFHELATDFKKRKFRYLLCSPMGLMRDKVPMQTFVNNIVKFQGETKAIIKIVTCGQKPIRNWRNGQNLQDLKLELDKLLHQETNKSQHIQPNQPLKHQSETSSHDGSLTLIPDSPNWLGWPDDTPPGRDIQPQEIISPTSLVMVGSPPTVPGHLPFNEVVKMKESGKQSKNVLTCASGDSVCASEEALISQVLSNLNRTAKLEISSSSSHCNSVNDNFLCQVEMPLNFSTLQIAAVK